MEGCQFEDAALLPARKQTQHIAHIAEGFDVVELAAREQRDKGSVDVSGFVIAYEEPVFSPEGLSTERIFTGVVVDGQSAVFEETRQRSSLISCVLDGLGDGSLVEYEESLFVAPGKKLFDDGFGVKLSFSEPKVGRGGGPLPFEFKKFSHPSESLFCPERA
jgi:hypothetical protein